MRLDTFLLAFGLSSSLRGVQAETQVEQSIASIWDDFKNAVDCGACQVCLIFGTSIACKVLNLRYVILQVLLGSIKVTAGLGEKFMIDVFTGLCKISGVRWRFS